MKAAKLIILTFASMMLINCGGSGSADKALNTNGQSERGIPLVDAKTSDEAESINPSGVVKGRIYKDDQGGYFKVNDQTQSEFQNNIYNFLSPQLLREDIGEVNGVEETGNTLFDTGVEFWGRGFQYKDGSVFDISKQLISGRDVLSLSTAELRINIYQKVNGEVQEVPIHFNSKNGLGNIDEGQLVDSVVQVEADGSVFIQLIFADALGKISLTGYLVNNADGIPRYEGQVSFKNTKRKTASGTEQAINASEEILGRFIIRACGFFKCL